MTIIEIRPFRNGWQVHEAPGVQPARSAARKRPRTVTKATEAVNHSVMPFRHVDASVTSSALHRGFVSNVRNLHLSEDHAGDATNLACATLAVASKIAE